MFNCLFRADNPLSLMPKAKYMKVELRVSIVTFLKIHVFIHCKSRPKMLKLNLLNASDLHPVPQ